VDLSNFVRWQFGSSVIINFEYDLVGGNGTFQVPIIPRCFGTQS